MKKMMVVCATAVIMFALIIAFNYEWIYYRVYPFDRISGTYSIKINDENVTNIDEYYEYENQGKIRLENGTKNFKIKGGKYGFYKIGFMLDNEELYNITNDEYFRKIEDLDVSAVYFCTNWWHIVNADIDIKLNKENDEWYISYEIDYGANVNLSRKIKLDELKKTQIIFGI